MAGKANVTPVTYLPSLNKKQQQPFYKNSDLVWVRPDGRGFHQCGPAFFRTGAINAAPGSAYAELGNTKVMVSVFGPRESKKAMTYSDIGRLNCNVSYTTFATSAREPGSDHKEFSSMLHKALEGAIRLETFPKTTVDIFALVLESGGGDFPVLISCSSLALADAGIMLHDLVAAVSVVLEKAKAVVDTKKSVSWADIIAVAGAEAISICGGPTIQVQLGRLDSVLPDPEGRLPEETLNAFGLKQSFQKKGLLTRELVALSGAHTLGSKGFGSPAVFDNSYYKVLLEKLWASLGGMSSMIGLPSDQALAEDGECMRWIEKYAKDQNLFFEDFSSAYTKLVNSGAQWRRL